MTHHQEEVVSPDRKEQQQSELQTAATAKTASSSGTATALEDGLQVEAASLETQGAAGEMPASSDIGSSPLPAVGSVQTEAITGPTSSDTSFPPRGAKELSEKRSSSNGGSKPHKSSSSSTSSDTVVNGGASATKKNGTSATDEKNINLDIASTNGSQALWRCLLNVNQPAPDPRYSLDDAPIIPLANAGFFSRYTYHWIQPLLTLGYQRFLVKEDLWRLSPDMESGPLAEKLIEHWERRLAAVEEWNRNVDNGTYKPGMFKKIWLKLRKKDGKKPIPGLEWAVSDTFKVQFWSAGIIKVFGDTATTCSSLVTKQIINFGIQRYAASRGVPGYTMPPIGHGIGWAFLLLFLQLTASLCLHAFFVASMSVGVLSRGALIAALYRKALSLSGKSRTVITNGRLVNHMGTDISRIDFASGFFHMSWTAPIQFIVVLIILIVQMGPIALAGVGFLVVATPLLGTAMKKMFAVRKKAMVWTDARAKMIQELLGGMRIIKFFSWEQPYLDKVHEIRHKELVKIRLLLIIRALTMAIAMSLPVIATIIAFSAYAYTGGNDRDPAIIFTSLTLFNLLRMPLLMLPLALSSATDAKNAFNRLREVFMAEKIDNTYDINEDADFAIRVQKGSFVWEGTPPGAEDEGKKGKKGGAGGPGAGKHEKKKIGANAAPAEAKKQSRMPWKKSNIAEKNQAANGNPEREAVAGTLTDGTVPVGADDSAEKARISEQQAQPARIEEIDLVIPRGQLCAIVGPVGSGKSSLLSSLIGEMRRTSGSVQFGGTVGYCAQQAWIQNATVKENILFGQPYDEKRYNAAVYNACLTSDLDVLPNGDMTEIGEKGINLSGGQKQRVNIARALYYNADITLLDDPLSAVDAHVGQFLFEHALKGALKGKTRVLVTHALHFLPHVDNIITIDEGKIVEQGTYPDLMARKGAFYRLVEEFGNQEEEERKNEQELQDLAAQAPLASPALSEKKGRMSRRPTTLRRLTTKVEEDKVPKPAAKLMQEEERATGAVGAKVYAEYSKAAHLYMMPVVLLMLILMQGASTVNAYVLVWWQRDQFNRSQGFYIGLYAAMGVAVAIFTFFMGATAALAGFNVSVNLHRRAIERVMRAPMSMFDTTPLGRIMNRFSKDMDTIDNTLNDSMRMALSTFGQIIGSIVLIAIVNQYFLIAVVVILFMYGDFARVYRYSAREIKRLDNILRSTLYAHFSESLSGLATVRAYAETERFIATNAHNVDVENRAYYLTVVNQRWLGLRLDFLGTILTFVVAIISVVESTTLNPSQIGLILTYILTVQMSFTWAVRQLAEVENDMNSVERLLHYGKEIEQEAPAKIAATEPPASWPENGALNFENVHLRYRPGLPLVLQGLSMNIKGGEKIGVVGRTGAGKSSIMQAIFRIVELDQGKIEVDGRDISKMGLHSLRSKISIIPQDALLFSGTLRSNLDPFEEHDDLRLFDALRRAYLIDRRDENGELASSEASNRFKDLSMNIEEEGNNLSVGQRSLISLARALVKDSRVVILDEATASVDVATDSLIQNTIRTEFGGRTLLTIAHRLRTIISYDRVLVMDKGQIAEFATPAELFEKKDGIFRGMCDQSSITKEDILKSRHDTIEQIHTIEEEAETAATA